MPIKLQTTFEKPVWWREFFQKNLILALVFSIVLHAVLAFYLWEYLHRQNRVQTSAIEAQLVKVEPPKKIEPEKIPEKPLEKTAPPKPKKTPPTEKPVEPQPPVEPLPVSQPENIATLAPPAPVVEAPAVQTPTVEDSPVVLEEGEEKTPAYQYVETRFDVFTDIETKKNRAVAGSAEMIYETLENGTRYHISNQVSPKGLAALFIPDLLQTSAGEINAQGLQPQDYLYKFGDKKSKTYAAHFDWQAKLLTLENAKGTQTKVLEVGVQDLLSFMYQFMFVAPLSEMRLTITNGKKLSVYDYTFEGEEVLETKLGNINTVHISHDATEKEEKTELWLAAEYRYLPVKIRKTEKDKVYEMLANSIKTDVGVLNNTSQEALNK
jgi:hypothetical protein